MNIIKEISWQLLLQGFGFTIWISAWAGILGIALGFGLYLLCHTGKWIGCLVPSLFVRLVKGTPIPILFMLLLYILLEDEKFPVMMVTIAVFSIYFAADVIMLLQEGLGAMGRGQEEAAMALGYTRQKTFFKILLPQIVEQVLPALKQEYISLIRLISVAGVVVGQDLTKLADKIRSHASEAIYPFLAVLVIYYLASWMMTFLFSFKKSA